jgi:hypothetical protein
VCPFAWSVVRSRFLPRWLEYWLPLDSVAWLVVGMTWFLAPDYNDALFRYFQPAFLAELAVMLWLLIMGAKEQPVAAARIVSGDPKRVRSWRDVGEVQASSRKKL